MILKNKKNKSFGPKIKLNVKGKTEEMSIETFARWMCLIEAIDCVQQKCEALHINMEKVDWVKPIALQKYIDERFPSMAHDVKIEHQLGNL